MRLLVAIPCFNEEASITGVIKDIPKTIEGINHISVLVIDDGSRDKTAELARKCGASVISHPTNKGVGIAFSSAVSYALQCGYDIMVNLDGDGQFNPGDITSLVKPILYGAADFVTGSRFKDKAFYPTMPYIKRIGNYFMSILISKLCKQRFYDVSCGFRAYSRETLLQMNLHGAFTYTQETFIELASKKLRIEEVPIKVEYFKDRKSRVAGSLAKYGTKTFTIIARIYRDYYPFRFFMSVSFFSLVLSSFFGIIFFNHFLKTGKFSGFLFAGFLSGFFALLGIIFGFAAIAMDMLVRIRVNQERTLYLIKKEFYGSENSNEKYK